ncbi:MAG TPA: sterol desaturase family protein [Polyangiaceae bacterium]|jgi:sterol desaturase/sphingolipid hydroxylase (fatty acid hydroxylase superfamily)|nr:sterol desaturase family protein [Polyangiaceae bacterium]
MFESDFLDLFSRCHPVVVAILYIPGALIALLESQLRAGVSLGLGVSVAILGFAFWTFAEYWLHRLVFHWQNRTAWGRRLHFLLHGVHHEWPRDRYRLVMPPGASVPLYFAFLGLFLFVFGRFGWAFHAGFAAGYLFYDLTHYWLHHGSPRSAYGRQLRKNHMLHHFKDSGSRFAVSNLIWDRVFGTLGATNARHSRQQADAASTPAH